MNSQRSVIYSKRKNALFGECVDVDRKNTIFDVVEDAVTTGKEAGTYDDFQLEVIRIFSVDPGIDATEFTDSSIVSLTEKLFEQVIGYYREKADKIAKQTLPVLTDVFATRGEQIENIDVPFSDGLLGVQVAPNLKKAVESGGHEVFKSARKRVVEGQSV